MFKILAIIGNFRSRLRGHRKWLRIVQEEKDLVPRKMLAVYIYREMLEVLKKPGSKEWKEYIQWLGLVAGMHSWMQWSRQDNC
jgi:hypothetical protein